MESNNPFMRNVTTTLHMVLLTSMCLYLHLIIGKFEFIKTQALKVFKKKFQILIGLNIVIRNGKIVWKHGPHLAEFSY